MPEFAYVFNKNNELVMWNKNLETVLGYTPEELFKKDVFGFMEEGDQKTNIEAISKIFNEQIEQSLEQNILTKSGEKIPVIDTANYTTVNNKEYLIGMAIDISKLRETEKKLKSQIIETNKLKEQLQAENIYLKEKEQFRALTNPIWIRTSF